MSRWRRSASNAFAAASTFGLLVMLLGSSAGCEFISRVDPSTIPPESGAGGGSGCTAAEACPGTDTVCRARTCTTGICGFSNAPAGTTTSNEPLGDCLREVCDGQGTVTTEPNDADILDDKSDCTTDICAVGAPKNMPLAAGGACTSNGGKVCDGAGSCVECAVSSDCATLVCIANKCVSQACVDMVKNGTETDTDCGGPDCAGCADGKSCSVAGDCTSKVCKLDVCQIPSCSDTIENGIETDVDCGGSCTPCGPGLGCSQGSDCAGGACSGSVCLETCTDSIKNANETDVDCGGPTCSSCAEGATCSVSSDCTSTICNNGVCQAGTCADGVLNGAETAIDCGGATCMPCADKLGCNVPSDCISGVCTGMVCQTPLCTDTLENGTETDIDCGGVCPGCDLGEKCNQNADCASNICVGNVCVVALCGDGLVTSVETCDDGNTTSGDGCNSTCVSETGFTCNGAMPTVCTAICNDSIVVMGEGCDDGNATDGDGCSVTCNVELGYECSGITSVCTSKCGDGIVLLGETCDDGNKFGGDGCGTTCMVETGFNCTGLPSNCMAICGDSLIVGFEECDDGNTTSGDGCSGMCSFEPSYSCTGLPSVCHPVEQEPNDVCGDASVSFRPPFVLDGRIAPAGDLDYIKFTVPAHVDLRAEVFAPTVAQCTGGADPDLTLYASDCATLLIFDDNDGEDQCPLISGTPDAMGMFDTGARKLAPGTYYLKVNDHQDNNILDAYQVRVTFDALCGNSVIEGSETCDDGNLIDGDGCAANCLLEPMNEVEPNDICGQATGPFAAPLLFNGSLTPINDKDLYAFTLSTHADIRVQTFSPSTGTCTTGVDTLVQLRAADCNTVLTTNDNGGLELCSLINSTTHPAAANMPPGTYYVRVEENGNNAMIANYQLLIGINALCADGVKQGSETCDDANTMNGDGCANNCRVEQGWTCTGTPNVCTFNCNDGAITGTEQCDDGNSTSGDGCSDLCVKELDYNCSGMPSVCVSNCGNGLIETDGTNECDDANLDAGDGCSPTCDLELNYHCLGQPSTCALFENVCNDGMDNDGDGAADAADTDCQIPAYFPACAAGETLRVFKSIDVPKMIPDNSVVGITSNLLIGPGAGTIVRAALLYDITHTYDGDLKLYLTPPNIAAMDVCSGNGAIGDNFTNTILDTTCGTAITGGVAPFSGCYRPETSFATLGSTQASGLWVFKAVDDINMDKGTINKWAMIFCIAP